MLTLGVLSRANLLLEVGLDYFVLKLRQYLVLILWVFAEAVEKVLGGGGRCLSASKEESEGFVNDSDIPVLEMIVTDQNG